MRLLGIDVGERELRVARGERLLGAPRLSGVERIPIGDPTAVSEMLRRLGGGRSTAILTALPASSVTHRLLVMPFRDRRRLNETVPLELTGNLPLDPADVVVAHQVLGPAPGGSTVLAAAAHRADIAAHLEPFTAARLVPARVDLAPLPVWNLVANAADAAILLADGMRSALSLRHHGRLSGLRALGAPAADPSALAHEVRWALAALGGAPETLIVAGPDARPALMAALARVLPGRVVPLEEVTAFPPLADLTTCALAAGLVAGAGRHSGVGLMLGGGDDAGNSLRRSAALAAIALLLGLTDVGLEHHHLARRDRALAGAIRSEAAAALPGARLIAPRAELEAAVAARARDRGPGAAASALALLRELSVRAPAGLRLELDDVALDGDAVRLHGRTESFDAVDTFRRALAGSALLDEVVAEEARASVDGGQVEFRLRARRRSAAGTSS